MLFLSPLLLFLFFFFFFFYFSAVKRAMVDIYSYVTLKFSGSTKILYICISKRYKNGKTVIDKG